MSRDRGHRGLEQLWGDTAQISPSVPSARWDPARGAGAAVGCPRDQPCASWICGIPGTAEPRGCGGCAQLWLKLLNRPNAKAHSGLGPTRPWLRDTGYWSP